MSWLTRRDVKNGMHMIQQKIPYRGCKVDREGALEYQSTGPFINTYKEDGELGKEAERNSRNGKRSRVGTVGKIAQICPDLNICAIFFWA